jgi:hypothetical protein
LPSDIELIIRMPLERRSSMLLSSDVVVMCCVSIGKQWTAEYSRTNNNKMSSTVN